MQWTKNPIKAEMTQFLEHVAQDVASKAKKVTNTVVKTSGN